ncbi:MAG: hypothetical protein D6689_15005 [Deltaproteobacteria bacterium]|nr:MAG: hypothetical protein D6689_15005 [Deltaproteobacteria bacterium]
MRRAAFLILIGCFGRVPVLRAQTVSQRPSPTREAPSAEAPAPSDPGGAADDCAAIEVQARASSSGDDYVSAARCAERAGRIGDAVAWLRAAEAVAEHTGDARAATRARAVIRRLRAGRLELVVDRGDQEPGAWVAFWLDGDTIAVTGAQTSVFTTPGRHVVHAERPGCGEWTGEVTGAAGRRVTVSPPAILCSSDGTRMADRVVQRGVRAHARVDASRRTYRRERRDASLAVWGYGAALVSTGIGAGLLLRAAGTEGNERFVQGDELRSRRDRVGRLRSGAYVAFGVGAGFAIATTWWLLRDHPAPADRRATGGAAKATGTAATFAVAPAPGGAVLSLGGRF